jgi:hypothetical protein
VHGGAIGVLIEPVASLVNVAKRRAREVEQNSNVSRESKHIISKTVDVGNIKSGQ